MRARGHRWRDPKALPARSAQLSEKPPARVEDLPRRRRRITNAEFTNLAATERTNGPQSFFDASKHGTCFIGKEFSGFGKFNSTRAALNQLQTKLLFEVLDSATQSRLSDVKPPRGLGYIPKLGDHHKVA